VPVLWGEVRQNRAKSNKRSGIRKGRTHIKVCQEGEGANGEGAALLTVFGRWVLEVLGQNVSKLDGTGGVRGIYTYLRPSQEGEGWSVGEVAL
jgi:hypothetical protein